MKNIKIIIKGLGLFIGILGIGLYRYGMQKQDKNRQNDLVVGIAAGYAPFVSINECGEYEGFDIDVAKVLAQKLNKNLVLKDLGSMSPLFIALDQGMIDCIMWGISITQDRRQKVAMIKYQGELTSTYQLLFWKQIPEKIKTINDMIGMTISVEPGSAQDTVISRYNFINKKSTEKVDDALLDIQYGKSDAAFVEQAIALKFKKKYPAEVLIMDVALGLEDQVEGVGIVIKKNNLKLMNTVQKAIDDITQKGTIKALEKKWGVL